MDYRNTALCQQCGGQCCRIYAPENRPRKLELEEWVACFHAQRENYGVEPRFDPLQVFQAANEPLRAALRAQGIDLESCEYLGPTGCLIPWAARPSQCRKYRCRNDVPWEEVPDGTPR
jgi:hypothetical protein